MVNRVLRRAIDIIFSILVLAVTWPLIAVFAVLIRRDSLGPAMFRQTRIGQDHRKAERRRGERNWDGKERRQGERRKEDLLGSPFTFYKFRTMFGNARELFPDLYAYNYSPHEIATMYFKNEDDPRHTPFGRRLRRTSLDELPNFINVLRGNMALIGPRPDIPEMVRYYYDWQKVKLSVKPGVTGLAQVNGRGRLAFQETLSADVYYAKNQSFLLDAKILAKTIKAIILRAGAF